MNAHTFKQGYNIDIVATSKCVSTIHIHGKLRMVNRDKVIIKTSSTHEEQAVSAKRKKH